MRLGRAPRSPHREHPCPRVIHLPGERCNCAARLLDVRVPHGYLHKGDEGCVHAVRLHNLRWRVSACGAARRGGDPRLRLSDAPLPPSLQALADDHKRSLKKALRPLSPERERRPPRGSGLRRSPSPALLDYCRTWSATTAASPRESDSEDPFPVSKFSSPGTADSFSSLLSRGRSSSASIDEIFIRRHVRFCEEDCLVTEVPVIQPPPKKVLSQVPERGSKSTSSSHTSNEDATRENLARLQQNHTKVMEMFRACAACYAALLASRTSAAPPRTARCSSSQPVLLGRAC